MGNCLGKEEKQPKYPPSQLDLNRSQSQAQTAVSPNGINVSIDHTRPLPSTPKVKGKSLPFTTKVKVISLPSTTNAKLKVMSLSSSQELNSTPEF